MKIYGVIKINKGTFQLKAQDEKELFVYRWLPERNTCQAIIQIAHGMAEHAGRYEEFAKSMVKEGYALYANDHRGHGRTAKSMEERGVFADKGGWDIVVEDMYQLTKHIKEQWPGKPIILLGHSMGSLLTRHYISLYGGGIKAVILSGTSGQHGLILDVGRNLAKIECTLRGKRYKSVLLNKLSFGSFNIKFEPARTEFDWISRDEKAVDKYIQDPYCGGIFSCGFFYDLLTGLKTINNKKLIHSIPKDLPILFISGEKDPVGNNTKDVLHVIQTYKEAGIKNIDYHFYQDARHELLHELNKEEVIEDIKSWLL